MSDFHYALDEHVAVLTLDSGENRFNPDFISGFLSALDEIEGKQEAGVLVVTSGHEKIFSNGLDLDWLAPLVEKRDLESTRPFFYNLNKLFTRLLLYPMPTIAAISGHAFAGGAILLGAFDFRFMRSDRGYICFPEVDLGIPFLPGMMALMGKMMPQHLLEMMTLTGKRLTAAEAVENHAVLKACHIDDLMKQTLDFAKSMKKRREIVLEIKREMYKDIVETIEIDDPPVIESGRFNV